MESVLYGILFILVILSLIVGIWQFFVYAKLSWARRANSRDLNGLEIAREVLDKSGDQDTKVKSSFWSLTYVDYSSSSNTLKLGRIDSKRKSLWTVATTGRQAYSAHVLKMASRGEKPPISTFWFRLQTFWFGMMMSMLFNFGVMISAILWANGIDQNVFNLWFWIMLGILLIVPFIYSFASFKTSKLMLENIEQIFGGIFSEQEINQIRKLWKLEYINSIIEMIKVIIVAMIVLIKAIATSKE